MSEQETLLAAKEKLGAKEQEFRNNRLIVFKLGEEEYSLQIDQIREIVRTPELTSMPQTPSYIKGVANIRGNIIVIVDLEEKFEIPVSHLNQAALKDRDQEKENNKNINKISETHKFTLVIESDQFKIGILVREVPKTLAASDDEIDESLNIVHDSSVEGNYIKGIVKVDDRIIILIDILKVMSESEVKTQINGT